MTDTALIAGLGGLPAALVAAMDHRPLICALDGSAPAGLAVDTLFRIERLIPFLRALQDRGIARVVFAGAMARPRLDPALFDAQTAQLVPRLLAAMQAGDDATLRAVLALFEEQGFAVDGVAALAPALVPGLLPGPRHLCGDPTPRDRGDAARAAAIVAALGAVDVGQGAVVAQGQCLGVETLAGTDALLASVAALPMTLRPPAAQGRGLFYKAPKPGQDRRIDLPTLGPHTVALAESAGLGGLAWEAGGVICLDLPEMIAAAGRAGLFLWARDR